MHSEVLGMTLSEAREMRTRAEAGCSFDKHRQQARENLQNLIKYFKLEQRTDDMAETESILASCTAQVDRRTFQSSGPSLTTTLMEKDFLAVNSEI